MIVNKLGNVQHFKMFVTLIGCPQVMLLEYH